MRDRDAGGARARPPVEGLDTAAARILSQEPRELTARELLALLLEPGLGRRRAHDSATRLLCGFPGEDGRGPLRRIGRATPHELGSVGGITRAAAARVTAALELGRRFAAEPRSERDYIESARDVYERFYPRMRDLDHEEFWLLVINVQAELVREVMISRGTGSQIIVHPRDVFRPAIREAGDRLILVHNHPSGEPTPSAPDRALTVRLSEAAGLLGFELWDHVVIGEQRYISFREEGLPPYAKERPARRATPRRRAGASR